MTALLCPLCSQPRFSNLESLRSCLVNAATQHISCPVCNDVLMGLDKLTIHLFGHTLAHQPEHTAATVTLCSQPSVEVQPSPFNTTSLPKEQEVVGEMTQAKLESTVNVEDLSYLTSWLPSARVLCEQPKVETELSEYMSDLFAKKLPIFNYVFAMDESKVKQRESIEECEECVECEECGSCFADEPLLQMHKELLHHQYDLQSAPQPMPVVLQPELQSEPQSGVQSALESGTKLGVQSGLEAGPQSGVEPAPQSELEAGPQSGVEPAPPSELESCSQSGVEPAPPSELESCSQLEAQPDRYFCQICPRSFKMKGSLMVHCRVAHTGAQESLPSVNLEERGFKCNQCGKTFKKEQHLTQHVKTHEGKQWQCETCGKHFTTKYFLKKHQRLHTGEMPYCCPACNKTFTFQQSYHKHILYHSDEKPHECAQCGRSFKELSTLHNHQRIHSGEKPFSCETCGKCFRQRVSYIVHQRIHTGVLPYQCTACKKKFRYKVSQRSHKCLIQPPGVVVRQPGDLIQRILEHRSAMLHGTGE